MNMGMGNMNQQIQNIINNNNANMQNMPNMSNNNPSSNPSSSQNGPGISVVFRVSGAGQNTQNSAPIIVQCMPDEKVSDIIKRYRIKSGDDDPSKKFIFNFLNKLSVSHKYKYLSKKV